MVEEKSPVPLTKFLPFSSKPTFLLSAFWYWRWAWNSTFLLCRKTCYIHPIGSAGENWELSRGRRDLHFPGFFLPASWLPPDSEYHPSNFFFFITPTKAVPSQRKYWIQISVLQNLQNQLHQVLFLRGTRVSKLVFPLLRSGSRHPGILI